jgi:hypothetical protein
MPSASGTEQLMPALLSSDVAHVLQTAELGGTEPPCDADYGPLSPGCDGVNRWTVEGKELGPFR